MTRKTKHIFNEPWKAEEYEHGHGAWVVRNSKGYLIAENLSGQDANRFTHLSELYEALLDAVWDKCYHCLARNQLSTDELMEHGCLKDPSGCLAKLNKCKCLQWLELLRKVKEGK